MLPEIESLKILQDRDIKLTKIRQELERIPREEERANSRLEDDTRRVEQALAALRETEVRVAKTELDAETRRTTIERLRKQQFETRKNDEYQALAHEVTRYAEQIDDLETRELELMEEVDQCQRQLDDAREALAKTQALVDEELAQLTSSKVNLGTRLEELQTERVQLAAAVPGDEALPLYERLLKSKGGSALAAVTEDGQCTGCHMKLIASSMIKVHTEKELAQCENCARILHPEA